MKNRKLLKKSAFIVAVALIAGGFVIGPSLLAGVGKVASAETVEMPVFSVRTAEVSRQTLNAFLEVNGDIVSTRQVDVFPDVAGRLHTVYVGLGSYVQAGERIADVDPSRPGASFNLSPVYAPISGYVSRTPLAPGSNVSQSSGITTISANGNLEIIARIPEREVAGLQTGLNAQVRLQAYPGIEFDATVNRVSPIVDSASRTKQINLRLDQNDSRVSPGMFARVSINTRTYPDVLSVPSESIVTIRGLNYVFLVESDEVNGIEQNIAVRREVSTGVTLQGYTEITDGLAEGEVVITQGQQLLVGGEAVRLIGSLAAGY